MKNDDKKFIIAKKNIKNDIIKRQKNKIISQKEALANEEEKEQESNNYAISQIEQKGKAGGKFALNKGYPLMKGEIKTFAQRRKENAKKLNKQILTQDELTNEELKILTANQTKPAIPIKKGRLFHTQKNYTKAMKSLTTKAKSNSSRLNQISKEQQKQAQNKFIQKKRKEMMLDNIYANKTKTAQRTMVKTKKQFQRVIIALKKAVTVKTISIMGAVIALIMLLALAGGAVAVVNTPFGIFFSGEDGYDNSVAKAVAEINQEFEARKEELLSYPADRIVITHLPSGGSDLIITNWNEVIATFAAKTASDKDEAQDVVVIDEERKEILQKVFWDMNELSYHTETIHHGSGDNAWIEIVLYITLTSKTHEQMYEPYYFTPYQISAAEELLKPEYAQMMAELIGNFGDSLAITDEELEQILEKLPHDLSPDRRKIVETACTLVGKVNYFWGGKSNAIGWDNRWGTPMKVTAPGSRTTGTIRPFGLDCSGFVDWVFNNSLGYILGEGGGARAQHDNCEDISWSEALPGDLVFYPNDIHIGIIIGKDSDGELLVVHCASGYNNVVVTGIEGFVSVGRADI